MWRVRAAAVSRQWHKAMCALAAAGPSAMAAVRTAACDVCAGQQSISISSQVQYSRICLQVTGGWHEWGMCYRQLKLSDRQ